MVHIDFENILNIRLIQAINLIGAITVFGLMVKHAVLPYLQVKDGLLTIYRMFSKNSLPIDHIVDVDVVDGRILLRDGIKVNFDVHMLRQGDLQELRRLCLRAKESEQ